MEERISMSSKDLERLEVLRAIQEKRIKQTMGAQILSITTRQVRNLMKRWIDEGCKGIISRRVGVLSNNRLSQESVNQILEFFKDLNHKDFGPTLAHEYLTEQGERFSISSVRSVMIRNDLWHPKAIRMLNIHTQL